MERTKEWYEQKRREALEQVKGWFERDFVILDTETTNFLEKGGEVIQLSIIDKEGRELLNQLIKPKGSVSEGARNVHHISDDMLADQPTWDMVYPKYREICENKLVICYNDTFDPPMLWQTCRIYDLPKFECEWACSMKAFAQFRGEWNPKYDNFRWGKLSEALEYFGVEIENAHDALGDVRSTLTLLRKMNDRAPVLMLF